MEELTPGQNGLPPKKKNYSPEEKATLVAKAAEFGVQPVAKAYGFAWLRLCVADSLVLEKILRADHYSVSVRARDNAEGDQREGRSGRENLCSC